MDAIRPFGPQDLHALKRLIDSTIDVSYAGVYPPRAIEFFKSHHSAENILQDAGQGFTIVLEADGEVLATGTLLAGEVRRMFVAPDSQRRGLGRLIMRALEQRAKDNGIFRITLHSSLVARTFYEGLGFAVTEEEALPVGEGQQLEYFLMSKELPRPGITSGPWVPRARP